MSDPVKDLIEIVDEAIEKAVEQESPFLRAIHRGPRLFRPPGDECEFEKFERDD